MVYLLNFNSGCVGGFAVFIFSILGMQLFGGKFDFADEGIPRHHYNNFLWAFITTFRVITRASAPHPSPPHAAGSTFK